MDNSALYVSVDVETSGPIPCEYSLLSIGACLVADPTASIYLELRPSGAKHDPESLAVSGLDVDKLALDGLAPHLAMQEFEDWLAKLCPPTGKPIFVGLNAPFDWSFINYYFYKYLGRNPFGFTAIDIKAYFMGSMGCSWSEAKSSKMAAMLNPRSAPDHNALGDARFQAELFALMLAQRSSR